MTSFLVTYGTGQGQTAKVARYVDSVLTERGHDVTTTNVWDASTVDVEDFDAVLVGSSVNNRRHWPEVVDFVRRNREALDGRPGAFFQLSFASIVPMRWAQEGAGALVEDFVEATGWHPDRVGLFAGAVTYTQYDFVTRSMFKLAAMLTTGDTDTSRDYEYTDWDAVERFAVEFAESVEAQRAPSGWRRALPGVDRRGAAALGVAAVGLAGAAYWTARRRADRPAPTAAEPDEALAGTEVPVSE